MELTKKKCLPCEGIGRAFTRAEAQARIKEVPEWSLSDDAKSIYREYMVKDFIAAVEFINTIAPIAEGENHHPDIHLTGYRKVRIDLNTHTLGGVTENDLILAAKINALKPRLAKG